MRRSPQAAGSWRLAAALALAWPGAARAFLGEGDLVYDPANTTQTINLLRQAQQEFDLLGSLLGVSTRQFDQLLALATAVGNAAESAPFLAPLTLAQMQNAVRSIPGLETADLDALFNSNGLLDAFMGVPLDQWAQAVETPTTYYRSVLVDPAIARVGEAAGLASPAIAYAQWYAALAPEDQSNLGSRAAVDFSGLLASDWLAQAQQRRVNLEGLAAAGQGAASRATGAQTLADAAHAQAQLSANTNAILVETATQNTDAQEAEVRGIHAQNQILAEQSEARRDDTEMRLDAPP